MRTSRVYFSRIRFWQSNIFEDRHGRSLEPEKRLVLAILEDAILTFQDNHAARDGKKKRLFDQANVWIFNVSDDWVFSFKNICHVLEFNPEYIRKGLAQWREKDSAKPSLWQDKKIAAEMRV